MAVWMEHFLQLLTFSSPLLDTGSDDDVGVLEQVANYLLLLCRVFRLPAVTAGIGNLFISTIFKGSSLV